MPGANKVRWLMPAANDIQVDLKTDYRKKGLIWYPTYTCRFTGAYTIANTDDVGTLEYNTIDATLWFLHALGRHVAQTDDVDLAAELSGTVVDILSAHVAGTRFGIGVDHATGLLRGGAAGWALTWMDARIGGRPVTPRAGFPVEIEALWINALGTAADLLARVGRDGRPGLWWPNDGRTSCWPPPCLSDP